MLILSRLAGTLASVFRIGSLKLKDVAGTLVLRNAADTQHANLEINRLKMIYGPANNAILSSDANGLATWKDPIDLGIGANEFIDLLDTPQDYSGAAGKYVAVKATMDGLEFVNSQQPHQALFSFEGYLSVGPSPLRIYNARGISATISRVFLSVTTPPAGSPLTVDILKNGTSIFTDPGHRPQIAAGAETGQSTNIDVSTWGADEYLTASITQVGSSTSGANLTVHVVYY